MPFKLRGLLVSSLLALSACAGFKKKSDTAIATPPEGRAIEAAAQNAFIKENEVSSEDVERNIEKPYTPIYGEIPLDYNEHVEKWLRYFQGRGRKYMETYLSRSGRYLPMMKNVLRENGLPEDLVYVALIESGFSPRAHSRANAVGYWQFIRGTGKRYGLGLDTFVDERRDPVLSTRAAAEYFKELYKMLGSWHLSMAAYNVGENRVKRAVAKYYTKSFWELIKKRRSLPTETKNYVPKFIAAAMIAKDPAKYGFTDIQYEDPLSYDTVTLTTPVSMNKLASHLNVDVEELKLLNPKFRTDFVPLSRGNETVLRIPVGRADDALAALSLSVTAPPKVIQAEYYFYRIRRGDTLSTIARKHRTTVSQLRRLNGLSNRTLLRVGHSLKVPDNGGDGIKVITEEEARTPSGSSLQRKPAAKSARVVDTHTVQRGENLTLIARRYGLSMTELRKLNGFNNRTVLRTGQKLKVRAEVPAPAKSISKTTKVVKKGLMAEFKSESAKSAMKPTGRSVAANRGAHTRKHVVRRGETLYEVSKRYGVTLSELAKANNLKLNYRVMAGEKLKIPVASN